MSLIYSLVYFFFGVSSASVVLILLMPIWTGFDTARIYSEIIRNLLLGIGALFTGLGGFKVFWDYAEQQTDKTREQKWVKELRSKYPASKVGESFKLLRSDARGNEIWLYDCDTKKIHHIASWDTFKDLYFTSKDVESISGKEFKKYTRGEPFLTRGEFGG